MAEQKKRKFPFIVTIDGPAASGKSSVSRELARIHDWQWVSTGAFYRGLALVAKKEEVDLTDVKGLVDLIKNGAWEVKLAPEQTQVFWRDNDVTKEIFGEAVGAGASQVSQYPEVRQELLAAQRACAENVKGLVAEGRDCGTVVFPQAPVKIFLTARSESRAERRARDEGVSVAATLEEQKLRDQKDSQRKAAPMQVPENAHVLDTSELNLAQVVDKADALIRKKLALV